MHRTGFMVNCEPRQTTSFSKGLTLHRANAEEVTVIAGRAAELATRIEETVGKVIRGKQEVIRLLLTVLLGRGHVLIEDVPGVGKTTVARALAATMGASFRRIQFTSDLLPSDIVGVAVYDEQSRAFEFKPGPIFANFVLADEINRTAPRTQSALLEALNESQVTVDSQTHDLQAPFMVIATQNPIEHFGTYPLPESQMDRFMLRVEMGYPDPAQELLIVGTRGGDDPLAGVRPVVAVAEILELQAGVEQVSVDLALLGYLMEVVQHTRHSKMLRLGVSTRGAIAWHRAAQAYALLDGRSYCVPDDIKRLALPALAHRLVLAGHATNDGGRSDAQRVLADILDQLEIPL